MLPSPVQSLWGSVPLKKGGPDPEKEDLVMLTRNRVSRIYYKKKFFDYPIKPNAKLFLNMGFADTVVAGCSSVFGIIEFLDERGLHMLLVLLCRKKLYQVVLQNSHRLRLQQAFPIGISSPSAFW